MAAMYAVHFDVESSVKCTLLQTDAYYLRNSVLWEQVSGFIGKATGAELFELHAATGVGWCCKFATIAIYGK